MNIDPNRSITITLPFEMIEKLKNIKPVLAMFRDEGDVKSVIKIIDAIYNGAVQYLQDEEDQLRRALQKDIQSDLEADFEDTGDYEIEDDDDSYDKN